MGVDRSIIVGPFLKCTPKSLRITVTTRSCPDCKRPLHGWEKFCPQHGKGEDLIEEKDGDNSIEIRRLVMDKLTSLRVLESCGSPVLDGFVCIASNMRSKNGERQTCIDADCPDEYVMMLDEHNPIEREQDEFRDRFYEEIKKISELCASEPELRWGLVFIAN